MAEYSRIAKGNFVASASTAFINLPFQPTFVELINYTNVAAGPVGSKTVRAYWDANLVVSGNNPTMVELYTSAAGNALQYASILTNGISSFSAGLSQQFGPSKQVIASTGGASTCSFNVTAHGYNVGDVVMFEGLYQTATTGMPQMAGIPFSVTTVTDANNFVVTWASNGSNYTNLSGSPAGSKVFKVLYPFLYLPQDVVINTITTGSTTTISTTIPHNFETGQEIAFRITNPWGTTQLNSLPNILIPGSPIYGYVQSITDNFTFVCNINSSAFTAFTTNVPVNQVPGLTFPQVLASGDVNTGGNGYTGGALYPSPQFPTSTNRVSTINGPAIRGAFVNNTAQGFFIGAGTVTINSVAVGIMAANDVIEYRAYFMDYANP